MKCRSSSNAIVAAALLAIGGCTAQGRIPDAPAVPLHDRYRSADVSVAIDEAVTERPWWRTLGDPALDALVEQALADHPDVVAASSRIAAARAGVRSARSGNLPQVSAYVAGERVQQSRNGLFGAATETGAFPDLYTLHDVGVDASWELDVFGSGRARRRGAEAQVSNAEAGRDAVRLSLSAEVVRTYVEHLVVAQQATALQRSLAAAEQLLMLLEERERHGDASEQSVAVAQQDVHQLRAELSRVTAWRESLRHAMGALLGSGDYVSLPESAQLLDDAPRVLAAAIAPGTPSDLLRRRPDIRSAEAQFRQAAAARQEAVAAQYPRFMLFGGAAHEALSSGDLLKAASEAWNLAAQVTLPLLDGGRRAAARTEREAQLAEATAHYRGVVIDALADVEQSLLARQATALSMAAQQARLDAARRHRRAEQSRYDTGDTALTDLLRSGIAYERVLMDELSARGDALQGVVRLHKALGGPA